MDFKICAVFDSAAKAFLPPFFLPELGQAHRAFMDGVNNPDSEFHKHPTDYALYHLGHFENTTGEVQMLDHHICVVTASACLVQEGELQFGSGVADPGPAHGAIAAVPD